MTEEIPKSRLQKVKRQAKSAAFASFAFLSRSLQQVSALVMTVLAARFLVPAEYGVYTLAIIFITLAQTLSYTGVFHFVVASKDSDETVLPTSFWLILLMAGAASLLLVSFAYPLALLFDAKDFALVMILLALAQPFAGASAWFNAVLLRKEAMNTHFIILFLQNLAALIGGVILLVSWQSLFALVGFRFIRVFSGLALYLAWMNERPKWRFGRATAKKAFDFSKGLYGARVLVFLSRNASDLLLGIWFTTAEAGLYRFGSRLAGGATDIVAQPMRSFALSRLAGQARRDQPLGNILAQFSGSMTLLIGGVAAVTAVFARPGVEAFFDPGYMAGVSVAYAMALRAVASLGWNLLEPVLIAVDKTDAIMRFNFIWAVIAVVSVICAVPFGLDALAWSQVALNLAATAAAARMIQREAKVPVGGAIRAAALATGLVALYYLVLRASWQPIGAFFGLSGEWAIAFGCAWAFTLALPVLLAGRLLRVFTFRVFTG